MIRISEIYDKDVNFLLGSGASAGLFPTLRLETKKDGGDRWSLEELATHFESTSDPRYVPLFMHYYATCIRPAQVLDPPTLSEPGMAVLKNYTAFVDLILMMLRRRPSMDRRCNLFTTNYDGCIPFAAEALLKGGVGEFVLNDGTRGFRTKTLQAACFNSFLCQTGVFDRHQSSLPQINLIHLHGSVYWKNSGGRFIEVDYNTRPPDLLTVKVRERLAEFSAGLQDPASDLASLPTPVLSKAQKDTFWEGYKSIPVVNPTKWKFHETVFDEHYYQMLRLLSYELEKPNAVLITFGFSFADEHILNLVKRSLSNPRLQVFICCYDDAEHSALSGVFCKHANVRCLVLEAAKPLDFPAFLNDVLVREGETTVTTTNPTTPGGGPA